MSLGSFFDSLVPASRASYTATPQQGYNVRGVNLTDDDMRTLRNVLFAEISNRAPDKQALEARTIVNTALNRVPQYQAKGKQYNLSDVLREPNQYQGYGSKEYQRIVAGGTRPTDQQKLDSIDSVLGEVKSGKFNDNTNGSVFYQHDTQGKIQLKPGSLYKQPRSVADLTQ